MITCTSPPDLSDLLELYIPSRTLRSSAEHRIFRIPNRRKKCQDQCTFSFTGPSVWNNLPFDVRHAQTLSSFKSQLKTRLFSFTPNTSNFFQPAPPPLSLHPPSLSRYVCVCVCVCVWVWVRCTGRGGMFDDKFVSVNVVCFYAVCFRVRKVHAFEKGRSKTSIFKFFFLLQPAFLVRWVRPPLRIPPPPPPKKKRRRRRKKMPPTQMLITSICFQWITSYLVHVNFSLCVIISRSTL